MPFLSFPTISLTGVLKDLEFHKTNATHFYSDTDTVHPSAGVIKLIEWSIDQNIPLIFLTEFFIAYI